MYRCESRDRACATPSTSTSTLKAFALLVAILAALPMLAPRAAQAQTTATQQITRNFPQNALRGTIAIVNANEATLNGRAARLAPGSRIRNTDNMLEMSGTLIGREFVANYTMDDDGLLRDIWILRGDERAKRPWPTTVDQARAWEFDMAAQTWTRP